MYIDTTILYLISFVLLAHLFGDYVFQAPIVINGQKMAVAKTTNTPIALLHVSIYTLCYIPILLWCVRETWVFAAVIIFVTHLLEDRFKIPLYFYKKFVWSMKTKEGPLKENDTWVPTLYVFPDNLYHIACNFFAIGYAYNHM